MLVPLVWVLLSVRFVVTVVLVVAEASAASWDLLHNSSYRRRSFCLRRGVLVVRPLLLHRLPNRLSRLCLTSFFWLEPVLAFSVLELSCVSLLAVPCVALAFSKTPVAVLRFWVSFLCLLLLFCLHPRSAELVPLHFSHLIVAFAAAIFVVWFHHFLYRYIL